jgi:hypothetical protein
VTAPLSRTSTGLCVTADGVVLDAVAAPVLAGVLNAAADLFGELAAGDVDVVEPCAVMVVAGAAPALDRGLAEEGGCCGQLWVRLVNLYPSRNFPEQDGGPHAEELSWAVSVELGLVRPAPVVRDVDGVAVLPSDDEERDAAAVASVDAAILREALLNRYAAEHDTALVLGAFEPIGPEGGVVGGSVTAIVQVV